MIVGLADVRPSVDNIEPLVEVDGACVRLVGKEVAGVVMSSAASEVRCSRCDRLILVLGDVDFEAKCEM